jgi:hypothetical protein
MKKLLALLIMLAFIPLILTAQKTKDALYLKNGSIIYGKLMEVSDNNYKIRTYDGSLFIFKSDNVEKFIKENPLSVGRKQKGPGFALEAGLLVGAQNSKFDAPFSFNLLVNYTVATKNIFSIGSGIEYLGTGFSPLFLEYRYVFNDRITSPFVFFRGGTLFHIGGDNDNSDDNQSSQYGYPIDYKGGASLGAGIGISWKREGSETYLSFCYRYARTSYKELSYNNVTYTYKNNYNRLEVKAGFKF